MGHARVVAGVVALVVYSGVVVGAACHHGRSRDWSRRHGALDALLIVSLGFLALAYLTDLKLGVCFLFALVLGVVLVPVAVRRRNNDALGKDALPARALHSPRKPRRARRCLSPNPTTSLVR